MNAEKFVEELTSVQLPNVFNPYTHICSGHDSDDAPKLRRENLIRYLDGLVATGVESIWLGRDCGYRGARRTGIALTDEPNLASLAKRYGISGLKKATKGMSLRERTATEVWKVLNTLESKVFLWNAFPFHPHEDNVYMVNRSHTRREFEDCKEILALLLDWLRPDTVVALGADAEADALKIGCKVERVRHPSYGGHTEFARMIRSLYVLPITETEEPNAPCCLQLNNVYHLTQNQTDQL